jgi:hypothetical protein
MTAKERLLIYLEHLDMGQNAFEKKVGIANGYISHNKGSLGSSTLQKIAEGCPDLNMEWLIYNNGDMLKATTYGNNSHAMTGSATSGGVVAGTFNGNVNHNGDKDQLIETLTEKDGHRQQVFIDELHGFRDYITRQDDEIKRLTERLDNIVKHSYLRNKENMERIDTIIATSNNDRKADREQLDRVLAMLEKKIEI